MPDNTSEALRERIVERLETLRGDAAGGERQLAALDARAGELRSMLLRISGAMQVLEEILTGTPPLAVDSIPRTGNTGQAR